MARNPSEDAQQTAGRSRRQALIAAAIYLGLVLFTVRAMLPAPASTFLAPVGLPRRLVDACWIDQQFVVSRFAQLAHGLVTRPWALEKGGHCHPFPQPQTLGEHMYGSGFLAVVPHLLTGDPILTYNATVILSLWLAALAMYALVYHWRRNALAAFLAGCLFAFHPLKIGDPVHLFVHANQWTVLALLFAHRLFTHNRWRDALGLAVCVGAQLLESFYTVLALAIIGGVYGSYLLVRHARRLRSLAPKLAACAAVVLLVAAAVFLPYLHTRATWHDLLGGRQSLLHSLRDFSPGQRAFPGWMALALASFALLDGVRRRGHAPGDPRFVLLIAGLAVAWASTGPFVLPGTTLRIGAPLEMLRNAVPGLDSVRAGNAVGDGLHLVTALLAGLGAAALLAVCPPGARAIASVGLLALTLGELFVPWRARAMPGPPVLGTWRARPSPPLVALATRLPPGAVLDLPLVRRKAKPRLRGHYLVLSAFHLQPTAACHNSFSSPLEWEIEALVERLPDPHAADALYALGFRTLIAHHEALPDGSRLASLLRRGGSLFQGRARQIARRGTHTAYRLETPLEISPHFSVLEPAPDARIAGLMRPTGKVAFTFENSSASVYRHPDPLEPTPCLIRWYAAPGRLVASQQQPVLLPLALGAGDRLERRVVVSIPVPAGSYEVTLAPADAPDMVLGRRRVVVWDPGR